MAVAQAVEIPGKAHKNSNGAARAPYAVEQAWKSVVRRPCPIP